MDREDRAEAVLKATEEFIKAQRISCAEAVYQNDWVIENAYEFIEGLCDIAGYLEDEDDDE